MSKDFVRDQLDLYNHFNFPQSEKPTMIDLNLMKMRLNFMLEELKEVAECSGFELQEGKFSLVPQIAENLYQISEAEGILDGLVDLQVVLLGTAYLLGFLRNAPNRPDDGIVSKTFFERAWDEVWKKNMQKVPGMREKRGHQMDLIKPAGWTSPDLSDLVKGFWGKCKDCGYNLANYQGVAGSGKCNGCYIASEL